MLVVPRHGDIPNMDAHIRTGRSGRARVFQRYKVLETRLDIAQNIDRSQSDVEDRTRGLKTRDLNREVMQHTGRSSLEWDIVITES